MQEGYNLLGQVVTLLYAQIQVTTMHAMCTNWDFNNRSRAIVFRHASFAQEVIQAELETMLRVSNDLNEHKIYIHAYRYYPRRKIQRRSN